MHELNSLPADTRPVGDCDCCPTSLQVRLNKGERGMMMCDGCLSKNQAGRAAELNTMIQQSRVKDQTITIKQDVFNAEILSHSEIKAGIDADASIPQSEKDYVMAKEMQARATHLKNVILGQRQELLDNEARMRAAQVEMQQYAAKLKAEYREQFKTIEYQPHPVKSIKPKAVPTPKKKSNAMSFAAHKKEVYSAAAQYKVPAQQVWSMMVTRNGISAEGAAKILAESLGLI